MYRLHCLHELQRSAQTYAAASIYSPRGSADSRWCRITILQNTTAAARDGGCLVPGQLLDWALDKQVFPQTRPDPYIYMFLLTSRLGRPRRYARVQPGSTFYCLKYEISRSLGDLYLMQCTSAHNLPKFSYVCTAVLNGYICLAAGGSRLHILFSQGLVKMQYKLLKLRPATNLRKAGHHPEHRTSCTDKKRFRRHPVRSVVCPMKKYSRRS